MNLMKPSYTRTGNRIPIASLFAMCLCSTCVERLTEVVLEFMVPSFVTLVPGLLRKTRPLPFARYRRQRNHHDFDCGQ
ncbi:hypothetical protein CONPUDRAFT_140068 [Coniophora puteana RWD-64-598 SS2]|uniref:Uncharacterized protein n=1 Tax=Coniophora puteana (strain RWD-64-598) TaxID=741705 RepID=A0A5M3M924_CONPW|nr:uncharacterized protein CONPUDRAFT_140068 [Coniophora puteana RWD-64-598 SS2]EIW75708.1 hypothetical protein CONPUDRAFT_140068 [Coniophora puteana RWD-64-598 SS2]